MVSILLGPMLPMPTQVQQLDERDTVYRKQPVENTGNPLGCSGPIHLTIPMIWKCIVLAGIERPPKTAIGVGGSSRYSADAARSCYFLASIFSMTMALEPPRS